MNLSRSRFSAPLARARKPQGVALVLIAGLATGAAVAAIVGRVLGRDLTAAQLAVASALGALALVALAALWGAVRQRRNRVRLRNLRDSALW